MKTIFFDRDMMVDFRLGEYIRIFFQISVAQVAQISSTLLNLL